MKNSGDLMAAAAPNVFSRPLICSQPAAGELNSVRMSLGRRLVLSVCGGASLIAVALSSTAATLELGDPTVLGSTTAEFPIRLNGSTGVVAMQFDIGFPAVRLRLEAPQLGALIGNHVLSFR